MPWLASALAWLQTAIVLLCEVLHYLKGPFHLTHFHTRRNSTCLSGGSLKDWTVLTKHGSLTKNPIQFARNHKLFPCDYLGGKRLKHILTCL